MREVIMWLGSILISAFIMAFPILATLSFVFDWNSLLKFMLLSATVMFLAMFAIVIKTNVDGGN